MISINSCGNACVSPSKLHHRRLQIGIIGEAYGEAVEEANLHYSPHERRANAVSFIVDMVGQALGGAQTSRTYRTLQDGNEAPTWGCSTMADYFRIFKDIFHRVAKAISLNIRPDAYVSGYVTTGRGGQMELQPVLSMAACGYMWRMELAESIALFHATMKPHRTIKQPMLWRDQAEKLLLDGSRAVWERYNVMSVMSTGKHLLDVRGVLELQMRDNFFDNSNESQSRLGHNWNGIEGLIKEYRVKASSRVNSCTNLVDERQASYRVAPSLVPCVPILLDAEDHPSAYFYVPGQELSPQCNVVFINDVYRQPPPALDHEKKANLKPVLCQRGCHGVIVKEHKADREGLAPTYTVVLDEAGNEENQTFVCGVTHLDVVPLKTTKVDGEFNQFDWSDLGWGAADSKTGVPKRLQDFMRRLKGLSTLRWIEGDSGPERKSEEDIEAENNAEQDANYRSDIFRECGDGEKAKWERILGKEFDLLEECGDGEWEDENDGARVDCFKESLDFFEELPMIIVKLREEIYCKSVENLQKAKSMHEVWEWFCEDSFSAYFLQQVRRQVTWFPGSCFCIAFVGAVMLAGAIGAIVTLSSSSGNYFEEGFSAFMMTLFGFFLLAALNKCIGSILMKMKKKATDVGESIGEVSPRGVSCRISDRWHPMIDRLQ